MRKCKARKPTRFKTKLGLPDLEPNPGVYRRTEP
jgi:hypothetical protein